MFLFSWMWGHYGIWRAIPVGWLAFLLIGCLRCRGGKWKAKLKLANGRIVSPADVKAGVTSGNKKGILIKGLRW